MNKNETVNWKKDILKFEKERLLIQERLDAERSGLLRNKMGQFATPVCLADDIVQLALELMPKNVQIRFLDPAIGTGVFYSAFLKSVNNQNFCATGIEIDPYYGEHTKKLWQSTGLNFLLNDFTTLRPPQDEQSKYNFLICNPPYVRHHHIDSRQKALLKDRLNENGFRISGLAGLYCYFMLLADAWMQSNGIAVWLVPNEFMDVNYGKAVKKYLLSHVELIRVHRFTPEDVQFGDALVSSTILVIKKKLPAKNSVTSFTFGGTLKKPCHTKIIKQLSLNADEKWSLLYKKQRRTEQDHISLGMLFKIKRGIATGDNNFFILSEEQIHKRHLSYDYFLPILPSPRYLKQAVIDADKKGLPKLHQKFFLFDCDQSIETLKKTHPAYWRYIQEGIAKGIQNGYICKHRNPWYSQEQRPPALFVSAYIGRQSANKENPFRFILNRSNATVTNSYLAFYPSILLLEMIQKNNGLDVQILDYLNSLCAESVIKEGRVYGGGMYKLEPSEMAKIGVDSLIEQLNLTKNFTKQLTFF